MNISYQHKRLVFKRPAGTSRSILRYNDVWYVIIESDGRIGVGECNPLVGLSVDDRPDFEEVLADHVNTFNRMGSVELDTLSNFPAMKFGFESAMLDLEMGGKHLLFPSAFTEGKKSISINGLLWMGSKKYMLEQLEQKLLDGYSCIKMKIGAINFQEELDIIKKIRKSYSADEIEIRVDANGAFSSDEALDKLAALAQLQIHSIEQPIAARKWDDMEKLILQTPIPIALDEELIPVRETAERVALLQQLKPHYIILKPSLLGGFSECDEWINIAEKEGVEWWMTSALESNIGLNAIAQYAFSKKVSLPQGLGTGSLYKNNVDSPLYIKDAALFYDPSKEWGKLE
jgi:o-succinylbenzoate synthase